MGNMSYNEYKSKLDTLRAWSAAYYSDPDHVMASDAEYDELHRAIEAVEAEHSDWVTGRALRDAVAAGAKVGGEVRHLRPMLSLDNMFTEADLRQFLGKFPADAEFVVEPKLDGLGISLLYSGGTLRRVVSRGDGKMGKDLTGASVHYTGVPAHISHTGEVEVRGEVLMTADDFAKAGQLRAGLGLKPLVNARNGAAGAMMSKNKPYDTPVTFIGYEVTDVADTHQWLSSNGFIANSHQLVSGVDAVVDAVRKIEEGRDECPMPLDGAVVKLADMAQRAVWGSGSRAPRWAKAYKFASKEASSILREVTWAVGRTGAVAPRAWFDPVVVNVSTVGKATLNNPDIIKQLGVKIGSKILVRAAGDVIPEIIAVLPGGEEDQQDIAIPTHCPVCNTKLTDTVVLRCPSPACPNPQPAIEYAVGRSALDIKNLGPERIELAISHFGLKDYADLYALSEADWKSLPQVDVKLSQDLYTKVQSTKTLPLERHIVALGLRFAGKTISVDVAQLAGSLAGLRALTVEQLKTLPKMGDKKPAAIFASLQDKLPVIDKLIAAGVQGVPSAVEKPVSSGLAGQKVAVTGTMVGALAGKSRDAVEALVRANGGQVAKSVSGSTTMLVCGEGGGSKLAKAQKLGTVKVVTCDELAALVESN